MESDAILGKRITYDWPEFTQADVLRNNLERYGNWK
jgi:hypothetical protein